MKTRYQMLFSGLAPLLIVGLASCGKEKTGQLSPGDTAKLVSFVNAPDICPAKLCPVGTKIYTKSGWFRGEVMSSASSIPFPSGTVKPGVTIGKEGREGMLQDIPNLELGEYYVLPASAQSEAAKEE